MIDVGLVNLLVRKNLNEHGIFGMVIPKSHNEILITSKFSTVLNTLGRSRVLWDDDKIDIGNSNYSSMPPLKCTINARTNHFHSF